MGRPHACKLTSATTCPPYRGGIYLARGVCQATAPHPPFLARWAGKETSIAPPPLYQQA